MAEQKMKQSKFFLLADTLFNNIPMSLAVAAMCQGIAILQGQVSSWNWALYGINVCVAFIIATIIGLAIQPPKRSFKAAAKHGAPGSKEFDKWMGILVNTWYTTILVICMTILNTEVLPPVKAPFIGVVMGCLINYIPVWVLCFIISLIFMKPIENLAHKLVGDEDVIPIGK